jgi:hypothetical protein
LAQIAEADTLLFEQGLTLLFSSALCLMQIIVILDKMPGVLIQPTACGQTTSSGLIKPIDLTKFIFT